MAQPIEPINGQPVDASGTGTAKSRNPAPLPARGVGYQPLNPRSVTSGPGWAPTSMPQDPIAYSANGRWFAIFVESGLLLLESRSARPLALAPFSFDKAHGIGFHPSSQFVVAVTDSNLQVYSIEQARGAVRLARQPDLPTVGELGLEPPVFDRTGKILAISSLMGAVLYDFERRKPFCQVYAGATSGSLAMGFSGDTLYFVESASEACACDDYRGGPGFIEGYRLGAHEVERKVTSEDLRFPVHLRQGKLSSETGWWEAKTGRKKASYQWPKGSRLVGIHRLRAQAASVAHLIDASEAGQLVIVDDHGRLRNLGPFPESGGPISVRPQDDYVVIMTLPSENDFIYVSLADGHRETIALPHRICVDQGRVVDDERCPPDGAQIQYPMLKSSPSHGEELPTYHGSDQENSNVEDSTWED